MASTRERLETAFNQQAVAIPTRITWRRWLPIAAAGLAVGAAIGAATRWETLLINPVEEECPARRFNLPPLGSVSLEPVMSPEDLRRFNSWLGPQLPKPAAPAQAQAQPAVSSSAEC